MENALLVKKTSASCSDINSHDAGRNYIFYNAVRSGSEETVRLILERKPDLTLRNRSIDYPDLDMHVIFTVMRLHYYFMAELLLENGANPNQFSKPDSSSEIMSPLRYAVLNEYPEESSEEKNARDYVKLLLSYGADSDIIYNNGEYSESDFMFTLRIPEYEESTDFFLESGADIFVPGKDGDYPAKIIDSSLYSDKYRRIIKVRITDYNMRLDNIDNVTDCWVYAEDESSGRKSKGWCFAGYFLIQK